MKTQRQLLNGWGRTQKVTSEVVDLKQITDIENIFSEANGAGVIARGMGRAYGDAAQIAGGRVVIQEDRIDDSQLSGNHLTVHGGVSLNSILNSYVPKGYFVPVTPGTRYVSVGGAIAADIHGKNHHLDGTFTNHVSQFELITPTGTHQIDKDLDEDIFWATAGGMGLTGIIVKATFEMIPIESAYIKMETRRCTNLDELMAVMLGSDDKFRYSVAWIDLMAKGGDIGRSVLTRGDHAILDELHGKRAEQPLKYVANTKLEAPKWIPTGTLNTVSIKAFNELWYRKAPKLRQDQIATLASFFHPLDGVGSWNRIYGNSGFLQYQFVVPNGQEETLRKIVERLSAAGVASFLAVLKRFGAENKGLLSFPRPGWTLALDIPIGQENLSSLLNELDDEVLGVGGRIYLAKDSRASGPTIHKMYPEIDKFAMIKSKLDPNGLIKSDLSRRLGLI
ncbi:FAD-binding oxidoreductase [Acidithrix sp. C25]|uniref:FAD-binding oxidoreductase n=1 Tax=Acidithrix sp. C25 TaxID=1671482 RepID=UPI00191B93F9|nr:FAD-binding oxidoreductase [Acidithrix sp. C25]CAG4927739.1 unnamed protein product [Acidithrix sp. C25]